MVERIIYIVLLPGILANILHMIFVKKNVLNDLAIPIQEGFFGQNKTYRGFVVLMLFTALFTIISTILIKDIIWWKGGMIGGVLGFTYALFELPNSFLKRRLGIRSGEQTHQYKLLFHVLDKTDSTFGVSLVYFLISDLNWKEAILLFLGSVFLHVLFSFLLVSLKVKKSF